ncbi:NADH:ubiquinone reductase (Na(+)-transporting) subunit B [Pseudenhygromyxa sp. WMMC2535]|uniref:NADH:ubiquinone reductase (Na(+)-transporting) subunit B n=1 Tax=Pseudenhygromyxa sp. WMMC2535 TaxID=2712867 RepID=UPI001557BD4F|nr:NADH:ubiquinone reductase (Na(+)-transporting) subunit B [Pseudenhygromyxa sp. WMMC2535]NVB41881.1 NADH:ubiquinone reductase (Na(+)-transporting) subunit B [Pseudenhygromyxa sp. WMMC2535]
MDFLRQQLDKIAPLFEKGGKYEALHPLYEAPDTILYTPGTVTKAASHVRDQLDQKRMMITVVLALLPICLFACWNTGHQAALAIGNGAAPLGNWQSWLFEALGFGYDAGNVVTCFIYGALYFIPVWLTVGIIGGHAEVIFSIVRGHEITEGFLVTWFLFALTLPPTIPLWMVAVGVAFGVVLGKEVFGGVGMNVMNPALVSRAFLFFAYPAAMSGDAVWVAAENTDSFTGASWLAIAADNTQGMTALEAQPDLWMDAFLGVIPGSMGETSALLCLVGALILIATQIGSWRTMAGVTVGTVLMALTLNAIGSETNSMFAMGPQWHMVLGGWAFGMVFMATDPVSSAFTDLGKLIYGFFIGVFVVLVRVVNPGYPEGMMLAILFMNMFAPLIDHYVVQANVKRRKARYAAGLPSAAEEAH